MNSSIIRLLNDNNVLLENSGGKGFNLSRLYKAGFPVPLAFIICTPGYDSFVKENNLAKLMLDRIQGVSAVDIQNLESASGAIRADFATGQMPAEIAAEIRAAYHNLGRPAAAVRSSATAEDLPGFSFAGQQDTFLNIIGEDALLKAVVDCWSSLWTARAIGYRTRNNIDHRDVSLAVVVQEMAPAEASGVLFTSNPLTGKRDEIVIDATLGLGEALVSGKVEPDHYLVSSENRIISKTLGTKAVQIHGNYAGGVIETRIEAAGRQALPDSDILELARMGRQAADLFGAPQDIEWAYANGSLFLLQSRPVTSLYPMPSNLPLYPLKILFSFGAVQGMLDPMTPVGRDAMIFTLVGTAVMLGQKLTVENQTVLLEAGERLWINITALVNNRIGRRIALGVFEFVEPATRQVLEKLIQSGELPQPGLPRLRTLFLAIRIFIPFFSRAIRTVLRPEKERDNLIRFFESWVERAHNQLAAASTLKEQLDFLLEFGGSEFGKFLLQFVPRFGMGMASSNMLAQLAASLPAGIDGSPIDAQKMMRGLDNNVTTEMDLALWNTARAILRDEPSLDHFLRSDTGALLDDYQNNRLEPGAQSAIAAFLRRYGMRGLGEIDLGRPRWRENPVAIFLTLKSYLQISDPKLAPDKVFERGKREGEIEIARLVQALRCSRGGWIKARIAKGAARRMRVLAGLRESPKFAVIRFFGAVREALLSSGCALVKEGVLDLSDDLFFLHLKELEALAAGDRRDWKSLVRDRRQVFTQERQRQRIPRMILSDGRAFYEGMAENSTGSESALVGSPVSPGLVEGTVRVVFDPHNAQLEPGDILVCRGTDPSWTPLFLAAGGLVMEVGGMMTHGAVVAREYGIPAVVGVDGATRRLQTGQRVQVNGSTGQVKMLRSSGEKGGSF